MNAFLEIPAPAVVSLFLTADKVGSKLEQSIDEIEDNLERERRIPQDNEKSKHKAESKLKIAQENIEEFMKQKHEIENILKKNRIKQQLTLQLEKVKQQLEQESREKHSFNSQKLQKLISKANAETQQWKVRYEGERMNRSEGLGKVSKNCK
ncbi:Myosin-4 [Dirofilaria immitis]